MIHAYNKEYLNDAMNNLGEAFDYATNVCGLEIDEFFNLFISTGYADSFEKGNPQVVSGLSGTELVMEVVQKAGLKPFLYKPQVEYDYSKEYWCGWILAYYQWKTRRSFKNINDNVSMIEIEKLYHTLHEASEDKFVDTLNAIIKRKNTTSLLQQQRKKCGYSQSQLAKKANVNLRTLQQYELKTKDINKASIQSILSISKVLGCKVEDLLEF